MKWLFTLVLLFALNAHSAENPWNGKWGCYDRNTGDFKDVELTLGYQDGAVQLEDKRVMNGKTITQKITLDGELKFDHQTYTIPVTGWYKNIVLGDYKISVRVDDVMGTFTPNLISTIAHIDTYEDGGPAKTFTAAKIYQLHLDSVNGFWLYIIESETGHPSLGDWHGSTSHVFQCRQQ